MSLDVEILILKDGTQVSTVRKGSGRLVVIYESRGVRVYNLPDASCVVRKLLEDGEAEERREGSESPREG